MFSRRKWIGMLVMVLAFGMMLSGCAFMGALNHSADQMRENGNIIVQNNGILIQRTIVCSIFKDGTNVTGRIAYDVGGIGRGASGFILEPGKTVKYYPTEDGQYNFYFTEHDPKNIFSHYSENVWKQNASGSRTVNFNKGSVIEVNIAY